MTALYKEGRNQETCKMIRDHKDHIPGGLDKPANRGVVFLLLRVFLLSKRRWKNREYLSLFVIGIHLMVLNYILLSNRLSS